MPTLRPGILEWVSEEVLKWTNDADSAYLGARVCLSRSLPGPFHTLAHIAIERYLKGILHGDDSDAHSGVVLRKDFGHDLARLVAAASRNHPLLADTEIRTACAALWAEFDSGRYLVTADVELLTTDKHINTLSELNKLEVFDNLICTIRNEVVEHLTEGERDQSMLAAIGSARLSQWREPFELGNLALSKFRGI